MFLISKPSNFADLPWVLFNLQTNAANKNPELNIVEYIRTPMPYLDYSPPVIEHTKPYIDGAGKYPSRL